MSLELEERAVVDEALEDILSEPPPRDLVPLGCGVGFGRALLLVATAVVGSAVGRSVAVAILSAGVLLLVVGVGLWLASARLARGRVEAAVEAALRQLESGVEDREVSLRAATLLLANAYVQHGPTTTQSFGTMAAAARLGEALPLVLSVEEYLLERDSVYPVFTRDPTD